MSSTLARLPIALALAMAPAWLWPAAGAGADRSPRLKEPRLESARVEVYPPEAQPVDPIKRVVFARINRDRAAAGLAPVAWDEEASRAADQFCARQVEEKTRGHFLMDGIPPYARMSFAGIFGMHFENSVSWVSTAHEFSDSLEKLALEGHQDMMDEKAPADGHRKTILDPDATHVGVGYASGQGRFQMAQEFLSRGMARLSLSVRSRRAAGVFFEGRPEGGQNLDFVTIAQEPGPRPLSRQEASEKTSYSYPTPRLSYIPEGYRLMHVIGTTSEDRLRIRADHSFSFDFAPRDPGLYTLVFYTSTHSSTPPRPRGAAVLWFEER